MVVAIILSDLCDLSDWGIRSLWIFRKSRYGTPMSDNQGYYGGSSPIKPALTPLKRGVDRRVLSRAYTKSHKIVDTGSVCVISEKTHTNSNQLLS